MLHAKEGRGPRVLVLLVVGACLGGCGGRARITRSDGSLLEGRIIASTPTILTMHLDEGREVQLDQTEVESIRHPGAPFVALGIVFTAVGSGYAAVAGTLMVIAQGDPWGGLLTGSLAGGAVMLTGGVGMLSYATAVRRRSRERAAPFETPRLQLTVTPGPGSISTRLTLEF